MVSWLHPNEGKSIRKAPKHKAKGIVDTKTSVDSSRYDEGAKSIHIINDPNNLGKSVDVSSFWACLVMGGVEEGGQFLGM